MRTVTITSPKGSYRTLNEQVFRFAELTAQAYIDEYPDHDAIDPQWLRQTWEVDAANERWFTCTWEPYQAAALVYFAREVR